MHLAEGLLVHYAAVDGEVGVEIGGLVDSVERESAIDVATHVEGAVLQQHFAQQVKTEFLEEYLDAVVGFSPETQASVDLLLLALHVQLFADDA